MFPLLLLILSSRAVQISLLHHQCTTSKSVSLTIPQAAVIQFHRGQIIRENKIVDLLVSADLQEHFLRLILRELRAGMVNMIRLLMLLTI